MSPVDPLRESIASGRKNSSYGIEYVGEIIPNACEFLYQE